MPQVLVACDLHPSGRALLDAAPGVTVRYVTGPAEADYAPFLAETEALLIRLQTLSAATVARAGRLRMVSRHGVGFDAIDVGALSARGIPLAICGDANSTAVAEHAVMMILACAKRALRADRAVRAGDWGWRNRLEPQDLRGQRLLQVGYGRIGRQVAAMMGVFGVEVRAHAPGLLARGWPEGGVPPAPDLTEALGWADIVSLCVPAGPRPLIGAAEIAAMRPGAVIVNTARGGVIDEAALIAGLESGRIGAAGLDVFVSEPLPPGHALTRFDQVLLSPHVAGVTAGALERMAVGAARNVLDFFAGRLDPALVVNRAEIAPGGAV